MACTKLLALCLLMVAAKSIYAESEADAESHGFYGYGGHRYGGAHVGYSGGANVLRSYPAYRRSYYSPHAYRRPYGAYHHPARRYSYRFAGPSHAPAPIPAPVRQYAVEPAYVPAPVAQPLRAVPAVPYAETFAAPEYVEAPAPVAVPTYAPAPVPAYAPAPVPAPAPYSRHVVQAVPAAATSSQYHAQDEFGNVAYGYKNPNSAKEEKRDGYGNVVGGYSYVDATGIPKHLSYVADDLGFRVTSSNVALITPPH
jgi:hypothetical protein